MKTQLHTYLKQSQQLNLSPQMQQSLRILQLSTIEIRELIDQSLLDNPFLDQESDHNSFAEPQDTLIDDNPYTAYWKEQQGRTPQSDLTHDTNAQPHTLKSHLTQQLFIITAHQAIREIGTYLIDHIDEGGYLRLPPDDRALQTCDPQILNETISLIQSLDPVGVGARTLSECLALQLKDKGLHDATFAAILDNLTLLTEKGPIALAQKCDLDLDTFRDKMDLIKTLSPHPGLAFSPPETTIYITPDLLFRRSNGQWIAELNKEAYPRLLIDEKSFATVVNRCQLIDDKIYVNKQISAANWLVKSLEQRAITMLKVANAIIRHQIQFLNRGHNYLSPLKLKDIASEIDMHESTVSRAVTGKYAATPFGVIELKSFFSTALNDEQPALSNKTIQLQIKKLIDRESKSSPLSDDQLVSMLKSYDISVARRTVTKYRESLQIPSSYERKKRSRVLNF
ncbi:MAG: RNA polymerase factor sigma-54 [Candidatus Paracaedibacteraceae bacterium]|nr:RNA polymerase factor sigma-54 [Candidatus Paracaedibacteraceae bacterium]